MSQVQLEARQIFEKDAMAIISLWGYARHRGVSLRAVQKAIQSGRIRTTADGKITPRRRMRTGKTNAFRGTLFGHREGPAWMGFW